MKRNGDIYKFIGTYVDDLVIAAKNPLEQLLDALTNKYILQLKGTGEIRYHLGSDYFRDEEGTLCQSARQYVERMADNYERMLVPSWKQASRWVMGTRGGCRKVNF